MYVTPVIYGSALIPERFWFLLGLNPMTGVVEGFRWALLGNQPPGELLVALIGIALCVLITGAIFFRRTERTFADII
jgi:lipopolysaccharide transport system permease protein